MEEIDFNSYQSLFLGECRQHHFVLFNKTRLGRHRSLNGWVAIRYIPASDLDNFIGRVAMTSTVLELQGSLKF